MYLAYFDESGDSGLKNSPTQWFVLSCVLIHQARWMESLNQLVKARQTLKSRFGIPSRSELKAIHFKKGRGPLEPLRWSPSRRMDLYRNLLKFARLRLDHARVFAIAIDKANAATRGAEPRKTAWKYAIQRLHSHSNEESDYTMVFPDEGHGMFIRQLMRKMRRYHRVPMHWGGGYVQFETERVVEDPNDRRSEDSYFIQLADWCAYAAHRSRHCAPSPSVPDDLWDELGGIRHPKVNRVRGGPPGMVIYP